MSLKVWLPLNGDLHNQGCTGYTITAIEASPTFTAGKIGQCYQRANTSSQITNGLQIQDNLVSTFGSAASVAVWVKPLGTHTHYNGTILSSGDWNRKRWAFGVSQDNSQVDVLCGGHNNYISCTVPVNQWTHLASTFENGVCKLYKNGVYVGEKSGQAAFDSDANWTGICRETYAGGYFGFNGCINDLRIYDHALSAAEVKEISQGLVLHYKLDSIQDGILDSSGYGHKTSTIGTLTLDEDDSARYTNSIKFNGSNTAIKITENNWAVQGMREMTINVWAKGSSWSGAHLFSCTESGGFNTENGSSGYLRFPVNVYTSEAQTSAAYKYDSQEIQISALSTDKWNMLTFVYNSAGTRTYINGILHHTYTNVSYGIHFNLNARLFIGCEANGASASSPYFNGKMSDFRLYCTALTADDILQLYHTGAKIDNKANFHVYELNETGTNKLLKTGVLKDNMVEPFITLPDGSYWQLMLFHYVDGGHNLFTSSNATNCNDFGLYSRLKDINNFTYNGKYEFYVIQDDIEYRWTQTNQPTASSIAGLTTVSGYNNPVNGLAKASQSNTYIGYNAWWGACGCWTSFSSGGKTGIPGFGSHNADGICTRYLALYARIEKPRAKLSNLTASAVNFIEF